MYRTFILVLNIFFSSSLIGQTKTDTLNKVKFAAIPVVNYSNAIGLSIGALGQMFYKVNTKDTISPSSSTGIFGIYTTNKTYFAAAFQRLYLKEDNWRIMLAAGFGNINYQYWQEIPTLGGQYIGFGTQATFAMLKVERRVYRKLYLGINSVLTQAKTEFDVPEIIPDSLRFDERNMNNLGYLLNYDLREHQINPFGGFNVEFKNAFYRKWMKSGNNFEKFELTCNYYYKIKDENNILAARIKASIATGDVPFQGESVVGQDDIRGYSSGKYRNNQVYTIQAEYRWRFYKKLGMVGFLGFATAIESIGKLSEGQLLPGAGVGFRYMMIPSERINVGVDVAVGKDDWGLYFRIGEAFLH